MKLNKQDLEIIEIALSKINHELMIQASLQLHYLPQEFDYVLKSNVMFNEKISELKSRIINEMENIEKEDMK